MTDSTSPKGGRWTVASPAIHPRSGSWFRLILRFDDNDVVICEKGHPLYDLIPSICSRMNEAELVDRLVGANVEMDKHRSTCAYCRATGFCDDLVEFVSECESALSALLAHRGKQ